MKIRSQKIAIVGTMVAAIALAGCNNKQAASVSGGAIGALLGSVVGQGNGQMVAMAAGAIAGTFLGGHLGQQLDDHQQQEVTKTANYSLEHNTDGQTSTWRDPNENKAATMKPMRTYQTAQGRYCREFQQEITVDGQKERGYGTACRQDDGSWEIIG